MVQGFGAITWWGFTPALDLLEIIEKHRKSKDAFSVPFNILMIGSGDPRHIFLTLSRSSRHTDFNPDFNFFVLEGSVEVYARQTLLLWLMRDPSLGLREKTETFLELFGNTLIRAQTEEYLKTAADKFTQFVTDLDILKAEFPFLDYSELKFKERDFIENIFKYWKGIADFPIDKCWDFRLRQHLGVRYDSRKNVFDWDYSMALCDVGASVIGGRVYSEWRGNGIGFELREGNFDRPNKTLASAYVFNKADGERTARTGYWGDIVVSPYISFGVETENAALLKTTNNVHVNNGQDVSSYNLVAMLYELQFHTKYTEDAQSTDTTDQTSSQLLQSTVLRHRVQFLPIMIEFDKKAKYRGFFHLLYISSSLLHLLEKQNLTSVLAPGALVIVETIKFLVELRKDQKAAYRSKVMEMAEKASLQLVDECNDNYFVFVAASS